MQQVVSNPESIPLYNIKDGELWRHTNFSDYDDYGDGWKMVVPREERGRILEENHDDPTAGHGGIFKTYHRLRKLYFWPNKKRDVIRYIRQCRVCQQQKADNQKPAGHLLNTSIVSRPWEQIAIDFIGPLPRSKNGFMWLLVVVDCFSKYVKLFLLRRATTPQIIKLLEAEIFLTYGVPDRLICDNARNFNNKAMEELCRKYKVTIKFTPYYHPQANPVERVNRVVKTMISSYLSQDQREWDKNLAKIGCAIRNNVHEVTGYTPYFINFGRHQQLKGNSTAPHNNEPTVEDRVDNLSNIYKAVMKRMKTHCEKNKHRYDLRRRPDTFEVGDLVLRKNRTLSRKVDYYFAGLAPKYLGPYKVKYKISTWMYELLDENGRHAGRWHGKDLKRYVDRANVGCMNYI